MTDELKQNRKKWTPGFLTLANLRDILILLVLAVTFWKLLGYEIAFSLKDFEFSDFLSMFLALFAVSLSVAFYFKATDTSNQFYDNVYKFTRDVSEILGRIEAGFGERLRHLDEGYSGLRDKFESLPFDLPDAKKKAEEEKEEVEKREEEFKGIVSELMERARLAEDERKSLMQRFEEAQQELEFSKRELRHLQHRIHHAESNTSDVSDELVIYLSEKFAGEIPEKYARASLAVLNRRFSKFLEENALSKGAVAYMHDHGLLDADRNLTRKGYRVVRRALERGL